MEVYLEIFVKLWKYNIHQKPFLSLKTTLFQVYGNIKFVEGYSSQIYSCRKQFNLLEEYSCLEMEGTLSGISQ